MGNNFCDSIINMPTQKENARYLRKNMTSQERKVWDVIRNRQFYGYRFLRQYVIGVYIVDFICREKKLIIEIDGGQHNEPKNLEYDKQRSLYLESKGYRIIHFWNNEIDNNLTGVYQQLQKEFDIKEKQL